MTTDALDHRPIGRLSPATAEALLHLGVAIAVVLASVSAFAISTPFGVGATFAITLAACVALPAAIPFVVLLSFVFQNVVVAWYSPMIGDADNFDAMRGANFVILMTAALALLAAAFQPRFRAVDALRPWIVGLLVVCAVITLYLGLGAARGAPKDAIVYFRNTITPVVCFAIGIITSSVYRVDLRKTVLWMTVAAIVYGYCELIFTFDFLSLFHGDIYVKQGMWKQIQTGVWEKTLQQTGFVLRNLDDVMRSDFFNLSIFHDVLPQIFRIAGPTFHPIAYAYALAGCSVWLLFNKRWLVPLLGLPLLLVIGSKGAMVVFLLGVAAQLLTPRVGARAALVVISALSVLWIGASIVFGIKAGDYHTLGMIAGVRGFLANPLGQGLGFGGNLSSTSFNIDWDRAQAEGVAGTPMESAVGVMLYQMGIGTAVFFGMLLAVARSSWRAYRDSGYFALLYVFVTVVAIAANAVLQEEAFFSPLALGLCLLLGGVTLGTHWNETSRTRVSRAR